MTHPFLSVSRPANGATNGAQVSGSKMVAMASIAELMEYFGVNGLAEARDRFQSMAASDLPEPEGGPLSQIMIILFVRINFMGKY